jgi:hypothetical protein
MDSALRPVPLRMAFGDGPESSSGFLRCAVYSPGVLLIVDVLHYRRFRLSGLCVDWLD